MLLNRFFLILRIILIFLLIRLCKGLMMEGEARSNFLGTCKGFGEGEAAVTTSEILTP